MHNEEISPIFVMGAPRSGTTLTAKILGLHPALFMPGETHFFEDIYSRREQLGSPESPESAQKIAEQLMTLYGRYNEPNDQSRLESIFSVDSLASEIHQQCTDYEQTLTLFMTRQMSLQSKQVWGNNTPRDIFSVSDIAAFYPNAKIILCARDPRDFLGSYKGKWRATDDKEVSRLKLLYHPIISSLLWSTSNKQYETIQNLFPAENIFISPYENLVGSPQAAISRMCEFLGVEFVSDMLNVEFSNSSATTQSSQSIFSTSVGQWADRLSPEEVWICQKICAAPMSQLQYSPVPMRVNPFKLLLHVSKTPFALLTALRANKDKRGPLLPYVAKRVLLVLRGFNK